MRLPRCPSWRTFSLIVALFHVAGATTARAQEADNGLEVAGVGSDGGPASIFFAGRIGMSEGLMIYRAEPDGEAVLLTREPVRPVGSSAEFFARSGLSPDDLMRDLEVDSPLEAFLRIRLDETIGSLYAVGDTATGRALGRLWTDNTAALSGLATYRVDVVDGTGAPTGRSWEVAVRPVAIDAPQNVEVSYRKGVVSVRWTYPPAGDDDPVTLFRVHRVEGRAGQSANDARVLRQVDVLTYEKQFVLDTGSDHAGEQWSFSVSAADVSGRQGPPSGVASTIVVDDLPPPAVAAVEAVQDPEGRIVVSWAYFGEEPDHFVIYRMLATGDPPMQVATMAGSASPFVYSDVDVLAGRAYHYQVSTVDATGNESPHAYTASVFLEDRIPPPAPTGLEVTVVGNVDARDRSVGLRWSRVEAADFKTYVVLRRNVTHNERQPFAVANAERLGVPAFVDGGPTGLGFEEGATYEFGVVASDSAANFSDTTFARVQIPDVTPPEPPLLSVEARGVVATASWNPSTSRDVVAYRLVRSGMPPGDPPDTMWTLSRDATAYVDRTLTLGRMYVFSIAAVDSLGNVSASSADTVEARPRGAPPPPRNLTAAMQGGGEAGVTLTWSVPPLSKEDSGVTYTVSRARPGAAFEIVAEGISGTTWQDAAGGRGDVYFVVAVSENSGRSQRSQRVGTE